jgi:transcriptional regulator with XRE-family HTH domain
MLVGKSSKELDQIRRNVTGGVRSLRVRSRMTQKELAARLGLSQGRLSEIERGDGSFTAEQFLLMLRLFNVPVSHFLPSTRDQGAEIQNALVRLGAAHLHQAADVLPDERLDDVATVVRETLLTGTPRHLAALAPVLVRNIDRVSLRKLRANLVEAGIDRRLGWVVENTREAVRQELRDPLPRPVAQRYRRAEVVLDTFLGFAAPPADASSTAPPLDLLDATIASPKTRREVAAASSVISKRWGIVTDLQPENFVEALRAAHAQP